MFTRSLRRSIHAFDDDVESYREVEAEGQCRPDRRDLPKAFAAIQRARVGGLLVLPDTVTLAHRRPVIDFAASRRLPTIYPFREMVDVGGLACYGPDLVESLRGAAGFVDRILKGAKPGDLPVAQATKFDLIVNLKTAKTLGLITPPSLLLQADEVLQ